MTSECLVNAAHHTCALRQHQRADPGSGVYSAWVSAVVSDKQKVVFPSSIYIIRASGWKVIGVVRQRLPLLLIVYVWSYLSSCLFCCRLLLDLKAVRRAVIK